MLDTPLCHKTLTIGNQAYTADKGPVALGAPCIGSRCSLWVPIVVGKLETSLAEAWGLQGPTADVDEDSSYDSDDTEPSAEGMCADNLRALPWVNPATEPDHG